ncbi:MAG: ribosomal rRNA E-loop binding protein Ctc/L25/TL5 [Paenibacillaceae bacterium]|jgi:large subunit ribosomal protein L25|nr:ribosomal rRNA E-loop binding protein Ctc/L25/TL5 [Paenibacillaceae bacterium]
MFVKLQAELRDNFSKSEKAHLRKNGRIPAVVYGKKIPDTPLSVDEKQMLQILRTSPNALIDLEVEGKLKKTAVVREVQRDGLAHKVLSVAFQQVDRNEPIRMKVHLELLLEPQDKQLEVQYLHRELEVMCEPDQVPSVLQIDPEPLRSGNPVLVKDIVLPEGIKAVLPPEEVIVTVLHIAAPEPVEEVAEEAG